MAKKIACWWFGKIGIVVCRDHHGGKKKAYIGISEGKNQELDIKRIMLTGTLVHRVSLEGILNKLEEENSGRECTKDFF